MWRLVLAVVLVGGTVVADPSVDGVDGSGWTALQRAAMDGKTQEIEALLGRGANIDASSPRVYQGATALVIALEYGQADAARLLLARGASVAKQTGRAAVVLAARGGLDPILDLLITRKVPVANTRAVHAAAKYGRVSTLRRLLAAGASADEVDTEDHGFTPLIVACQENRFEAAKALLAAGASPNVRDSDGTPVLHWAVFGARPIEIHEYEKLGGPHTTHFEPQRDAPLVRLLLSKGAKVNAVDTDGNTALHEAARMDARAAATILRDARARRTLRNADGKTALQLARERRSSVARVLE